MKFKYVKQFLVYVLEVFIVAIIFVLVMNKIYPIETSYENVERFFTGIVVYQGLVFVFNKNFLDSEKDMALSYKTYLKYCKLYLETNSDIVLDTVKKRLSDMDSDKMFLSNEYKKAFLNAYKMIENNNLSNSEKIIKIECEIINVEHLSEFEDLKWNNSLILKFLK
ncbi:hypothetical protein [Clostridium perfringens]|uniref:hypothetical protein n=1 Tax=Clostridium perfringens TaxID=1502 RepID=UPI00110711D5|nr:hypothetical protein [Clostridium perfringens]